MDMAETQNILIVIMIPRMGCTCIRAQLDHAKRHSRNRGNATITTGANKFVHIVEWARFVSRRKYLRKLVKRKITKDNR